MAKYVNFYETLPEALMRLRGTVILYDGDPCYVHSITDHKKDGIFRIYLEPTPVTPSNHDNSFPLNKYAASDSDSLGPCWDSWLEANPSSRIIRKQMNSPLFNKFRPFELGMCNVAADGYTLYLERSPLRSTEQGLTQSMVVRHNLPNLSGKASIRATESFNVLSTSTRDCIKGEYPFYGEAVNALLDPRILNTSIGFSRHFALIKGPAEILFLCHKTNVVGLIDETYPTKVRLSRDFKHLKEAVELLNVFTSIN